MARTTANRVVTTSPVPSLVPSLADAADAIRVASDNTDNNGVVSDNTTTPTLSANVAAVASDIKTGAADIASALKSATLADVNDVAVRAILAFAEQGEEIKSAKSDLSGINNSLRQTVGRAVVKSAILAYDNAADRKWDAAIVSARNTVKRMSAALAEHYPDVPGKKDGTTRAHPTRRANEANISHVARMVEAFALGFPGTAKANVSKREGLGQLLETEKPAISTVIRETDAWRAERANKKDAAPKMSDGYANFLETHADIRAEYGDVVTLLTDAPAELKALAEEHAMAWVHSENARIADAVAANVLDDVKTRLVSVVKGYDPEKRAALLAELAALLA